MKTLIFRTLIFLLATMMTSHVFSQGVAINPTGSPPDPSAMLDVQSLTRGFLVPRMSETRRNAIESPATGLLIYQTSGEQGFYYNAGTPASPQWQLVGSNAGGSGHWSNNGPHIFYNNGNVGINTNTPSSRLTVNTIIDSENSSGELKTRINTTGGGASGWIQTYGENGNPNVRITTIIGNTNHGSISARDASGEGRAFMIVNSDGDGEFTGDLMGLGTYNPQVTLHVVGAGRNDGHVLFEGTYNIQNPRPAPALGDGTRMMWYPDRAAFRTGRVIGTHWDTDSIGNTSFASGYNTVANGSFSTAMGFTNTASGYASTAMGSQNIASGLASTAMGNNTVASGSRSTAMGQYTIAPSFVETAIGRYNSEYTPSGVSSWNSGDRLFVIGNGTSANNRSDALVVLKNGRVGIGTSNPEDALTVQTRIRSENSGGELRTLINTTGNGAAGFIQTYGPSGLPNVRISTHSSSTDHGAISVRDASGETKAWMYVDGNSVGWVSADRVRIVGGSDLAEQFDIISPEMEPLPGMVVSIDPGSTGKLRISDKPYDNKVAGIISGAHGVESGMVMGQTGTIADGNYPVSLTGRVYVYACDEGGDIQPGDLLTTSSKPGFAMKASDRHMAFGATIGKAMTGVNDDGFVLVLVNLQ